MSYTDLAATALARYLDHIGFNGKPQPDLPTLQALHALHPCAFAFENLDSWCGSAPSLDETTIFDKLVLQQRGGYCFEHNQLLLRVLQTLGFMVRTLSARVVLPDEVPLPRTHKVLLVTVNGEDWLVDVGFGGMTMTAPLRLADDAPQTTSHEPWRLQRDDTHYLLSAFVLAQWAPKYRFSMETQTRKDYDMANWYVATHPESRFRNDLIAARVDSGGRHALLNNRYTYHKLGHDSQQRELQNPSELQAVLQQAFGLRTSGITGLDARMDGLFAARQ